MNALDKANAAIEAEKARSHPGFPDGSWDAEVVRDLMFSLAWASWSAYHTRNAVEILSRHCPDLDAVEQVKKFSTIIDAPRGPGSPK